MIQFHYMLVLLKSVVPIIINSDLDESLIRDIIEKYNPLYIFTPSTNQNFDRNYTKFTKYNSFLVLKAKSHFETN